MMDKFCRMRLFTSLMICLKVKTDISFELIRFKKIKNNFFNEISILPLKLKSIQNDVQIHLRTEYASLKYIFKPCK